MKDIMKKLSELEATAPTVSKKKMLNEDSTTPPMNAETKPSRLKDIFETMASNKPIPVVGKQGDTQQTGAGFLNVTDNSPAAQALGNALSDLASQKKVQIVMPTQPGAAKPGQPAPAGATGQPQAGQMQMKEKWDTETKVAPSEKGKYAGKDKAELTKAYNKLKASGPHKKGSPEFGKMRELAFAIRAKSGWGKVQESQLSEMRLHPDLEKFFATHPRARDAAKEALYDYQYAYDAVDYIEKFVLPKMSSADFSKIKPHLRDYFRQQGLNEEKSSAQLDEKLTKSMSAGDIISDFEKSKDPKFKGKSKEERKKMALGAYYGMHPEKSKKKVKEGDIAPTSGIDTQGAGLGAGRSATTLESKSISAAVDKSEKNRQRLIKKAARELNYKTKPTTAEQLVKKYDLFPKDAAAIKKMAKELSAENMSEGAKPDFLDLDKDGNKKEPMKKAAADKKKQKVKESMNHRISAARLEGKSHGLRGHAHCGKSYEDLDEMKAYHEGYIDGLNECYGQGVYEAAPAATVPGMANQALDEGEPGAGYSPEMRERIKNATPRELSAMAQDLAGSGGFAGYDYELKMLKKAQDELRTMDEGIKDNLKKAGMAAALGATALAGGAMAKKAYDYHKTDPAMGMSQSGLDQMTGKDYSGRNRVATTLQAAQSESAFDEGNLFTGNLAKARAAGKKMADLDGDGDMEKVKETAFAFEAWDKQLKALINEGSEVNEGMSVSISKGQQNSPDSVTITAQDQEADELLAFVKQAGLGLFGADKEPSSAMSIQPASHGAPDEVGAGGVDIDVVDGSDGMLSLMKKLSGVEQSGSADYADEKGHKDCGCEGECDCNEETCNECGSMMEAGHSCGSKEMVDEVESEDQMEFEVAEDNAPDSEEAEHTADEESEAQTDMALAKAAQQNKTTTVNEGGDGGEASEEGPESKEGETDEEGETVSESFINLFKKLAFIAEESTEKEDEKAEKAGKKVAKDIEYDEGHKGKDDEKAEKAGKKVTKDIEYDDKKDKKEKVDEWANQVGGGPGKGTDASFEQDIDFMTKVIAGGLNKPKSTGQTTIPVIAGQDERMHDSPKDWATLAGIKK